MDERERKNERIGGWGRWAGEVGDSFDSIRNFHLLPIGFQFQIPVPGRIDIGPSPTPGSVATSTLIHSTSTNRRQSTIKSQLNHFPSTNEMNIHFWIQNGNAATLPDSNSRPIS